MGILDEAIRDHLDLKRRQGAREADIKRLEDEAFGPPSRPGEPDFPGEPAAEGARPAEVPGAVPPGAVPYEVGADSEVAPVEEAAEHPIAGEEPAVEEPAAAASLEDTQPHDMEAELGVDQGAPPAEELEHEEPDLGAEAEEPRLEVEEPRLEVEEEEKPEPPYYGEPAEPESVAEIVEEEVVEGPEDIEPPAEEPPAEPAVEESSEQPGEDVLEETPEFLRDTPEGDRLWFEQRPPKDFDFDK
jgi:hypothetical protein